MRKKLVINRVCDRCKERKTTTIDTPKYICNACCRHETYYEGTKWKVGIGILLGIMIGLSISAGFCVACL